MIGFGDFGKKRKLGIVSTDMPLMITSTEDVRLVYIDPTSDGFFDSVLGYVTRNTDNIKFIEAIEEVKEVGVGPFWKPIYDPSLVNEEVAFEAGITPAVGHTFNFWLQKAERMPIVDGKKWTVGSEYQYYTFLVWLINSLEKKGWSIDHAMFAVVSMSGELGHYKDAKDALYHIEKTGCREVCGVYDLANTYKILSCTNEEAVGFWIAGGCVFNKSIDYPLAYLSHQSDASGNCFNSYGVGWLVLS